MNLSLPPELAAIPPALRRTRTRPTTTRRLIAIIGFAVLYIIIPLLAIVAILSLNAMATNAAQQAHAAYQSI